MPEVGLPQWKSFAASMTDGSARSRGVFGVAGGGGYLCGVLAYRTDRDLRDGRTLVIELFMALDIVNQAAAVQSLLDIAETTARERDCVAIHIRADGNHKFLTEKIRAAGYSSDARLFHKPVTGKIAPN